MRILLYKGSATPDSTAIQRHSLVTRAHTDTHIGSFSKEQLIREKKPFSFLSFLSVAL